MSTENEEKDVGATMELSPYMLAVIEQLKCEQKYAAAHGYLCALHSFQDFAGGREVPLPMNEVFRPPESLRGMADAEEGAPAEAEQRDLLHEFSACGVQSLDACRHSGT